MVKLETFLRDAEKCETLKLSFVNQCRLMFRRYRHLKLAETLKPESYFPHLCRKNVI